MANLPELWRTTQFMNPMREFSRIQDRMERLMNELTEIRGGAGGTVEFDFAPSCEMSEGDKSYLLKIDLPGVRKEDVNVEAHENRLTIRAERREEKEDKSKRRHISEISYGSYVRSFTLPQTIDEKRVDAKFQDGVLHVTIPKTEESKAKQISIH